MTERCRWLVSGKLRPSDGVVPWHKGVDFAARPAVGDTLKRESKPGERIDVVHLRCLQQCRDGRPGSSAAVAAGKQTILSRNCLWPDGALDDVGVELDATIGQEPFEDGTARDGVADRLSQF